MSSVTQDQSLCVDLQHGYGSNRRTHSEGHFTLPRCSGHGLARQAISQSCLCETEGI